MTEDTSKYVFPEHFETILASLAYTYKDKQQNLLVELLARSSYKFEFATTFDNWDGGTYGHTVYFYTPKDIYLKIFPQLQEVRTAICTDINHANQLQKESIDDVIIELSNEQNIANWRGDIIAPKNNISSETLTRVWQHPEWFKIFLSHKTEDKVEVSRLKIALAQVGISCFVAHEDIQPMEKWDEEILNALFSADALVALITPNYYNSPWTDQEIGCAVGRSIPIYAVRMGQDPHGFIGKFQALSSDWEHVDEKLMDLLIKLPPVQRTLINGIENFDVYAKGKLVKNVLAKIKQYSEDEVNRLVDAFNSNYHLRQCYSFQNGSFLYEVNRLSKRKFKEENQEIIML